MGRSDVLDFAVFDGLDLIMQNIHTECILLKLLQ